jgi:hypothetical protein
VTVKSAEGKIRQVVPRSFRRAGVIAVIAGAIIVVSGVTSGSILLTGLHAVDHYVGSSVGSSGQSVIQLAMNILAYVVGFGGFLAIIGGVLLLLEHGSAGRVLIGLGGGTAIFGLLFAMVEALVVTGISAPIFYQQFFVLYWVGAILATISILMSRRDPATKPIL